MSSPSAPAPMRIGPILKRALVFLLCASWLSPQDNRPPVSLEELSGWLRLAEAERPSEEIVAMLRRHRVYFKTTGQVEDRLRASGAIGDRPLDKVRQVVQAASENWVMDRLRILVRTSEGLDEITRMIEDHGLEIPYSIEYEQILRSAGADEPALTLLWPPQPPAKPRFPNQEWRTPRQNVPPPVRKYSPDTIRGDVEMDFVVDGKVLVVLKHNTIFYNVICGRDLEVVKASFSAPLPKLAMERWDYQIDFGKKKPRGRVYACPADRSCQEAGEDRPQKDRLCRWEDIDNGPDARGFANARFLIDDHQSGAAAYHVSFLWALRPYTLEWVLADLRTYSAARMVDKIYTRGASFMLAAAGESKLRGGGATQRLIDEIKRNYRATNLVAPRVR